jgi:hypothetical protein
MSRSDTAIVAYAIFVGINMLGLCGMLYFRFTIAN